MFQRSFLVAALSLGCAAAPLAAQAFDEPSFLPPRPGDDLGIYVTSQGDYGVQGIWRAGGLGVRGGWVSLVDGGSAFLVGVEAFTRLLRAEVGLPFDLALTLGAGATFADATQLRVVGGLTLGRQFNFGSMVLQPYAHPRLGVDFRAQGDDMTISIPVIADVGADLGLPEGVTVRFGTSLGEGVYGLGIAFRFGRGVAVR
jgi:hypothetical protein